MWHSWPSIALCSPPCNSVVDFDIYFFTFFCEWPFRDWVRLKVEWMASILLCELIEMKFDTRWCLDLFSVIYRSCTAIPRYLAPFNHKPLPTLSQIKKSTLLNLILDNNPPPSENSLSKLNGRGQISWDCGKIFKSDAH